MMKFWPRIITMALLVWCAVGSSLGAEELSPATPLLVVPERKEAQVFGIIYPARFNTAQGDEAHYHLLVWQGGTSVNALIETPADDLAFHDSLVGLGGEPGDNLTMATWTKRHERQSSAPQEKVTGSTLEVRVSWEGNPAGLPIAQIFHHSLSRSPQALIDWRFGGNRNRWFNLVPFSPRPGCLACLYSCPSGKVSNGAVSVRDYVTFPARFYADTTILPPDGTPVSVTFRLRR